MSIVAMGLFFIESHGQHWQKLPFKLDNPPYIIYSDTINNRMIVGGFFKHVNNIQTGIFFWQDDSVHIPLNNIDDFAPAWACLQKDSCLYIGGSGGLYKYTNRQWAKLDTNGNSNIVIELNTFNDQVIVGGAFTDAPNIGRQYALLNSLTDSAGLLPFNNLNTVISTRKDRVTATQEYLGELYVAGNINIGAPYKEICRWSHDHWASLVDGIPGNGDNWVNDMAVYKGELYIAGLFSKSTGAPDNNIARWDGTQWKSVGGGLSGTQVNDLIVFKNELWAVGTFSSAGGVPAKNIAKWNGTEWCGFQDIFDNTLNCLAVFNGELYIGGGFRSINGDTSISFMAKWIGNHNTDTCGAIKYNSLQELDSKDKIVLFPNPFTSTMHLLLKIEEPAMLELYDMTGKKILNFQLKSNIDNIIPCDDFGAGVYIYKIITQSGTLKTGVAVK